MTAQIVADLDCAFCTAACRCGGWKASGCRSADMRSDASNFRQTTDLGCCWNGRWPIRTSPRRRRSSASYDHEVQGRTVGKPFVGPLDIGPADAAVLRPVASSWRGVAVGCGINPWYGEIDPYAMALLAIDEALRNVVAVGADPARTAILDNFCWGNPNLPDRLGGLVRAAQGCHDAAVAFRVPFISGKDSLFNEYRLADGTTHPIPGTLLISAIGIVPDIRGAMSMHLKRARQRDLPRRADRRRPGRLAGAAAGGAAWRARAGRCDLECGQAHAWRGPSRDPAGAWSKPATT